MLAGVRFRFLLVLWALGVATWLPLQAQINGVPASVTSLGFGGSANPAPGVRASVTSLGPNGYGSSRPIFGDCCANFFYPANLNPPLFSGRDHHHRDHKFLGAGVIEPFYVPYPVPYAQDADDDGPDVDVDVVHAASTVKAASPRQPVARPDRTYGSVPSEPAKPVANQPSTVLVFRDGHQSDVLNYAIVGDTLFDFGVGHTRKIALADIDLPATQKANDERGVDFQIPDNLTRQ